MAKHSKRSILLIVLTLCAALCFGLLTACDPKPTDTAIAYSVTVMKDASEAATDVKVTVKKGGAIFGSAKTDSLGKAEFELAPDSYEVELSDLPEHYEVPADASLSMTADNKDITITLAKKHAYEIKLVNPDGTPYTGNVSVVVCTLTGTCLEPVAPTNGVAYKEADKGDYHVKIEDLPAGYMYDKDADGYYTGKNFSATDTSMTITICPVTAVDLSATPMTAPEISAFKDAMPTQNNSLNANTDAHHFTATLAVGSAAYYSITPTVSGKYNIIDNDTLNYYFDGTTFEAKANPLHLSKRMVLEAGNTYYFKAVNIGTAEANANFVITVPVSNYVEYDGVNGNVELIIGKANSFATVAFKPTAAGTYKMTAQGTVPAFVNVSSNDSDTEFFETAPDNGDYTVGSSATVEYSANDLSQHKTVYFIVAVNAEYPATITVKIEKTAENHDTFAYAEVQSTLEQFADAAEGTELYGVPFDAELVYDEQTDTYTYDGKTVVVKITEPNDSNRFAEDMAIAYLDGGMLPYPVTYVVETANSNGGVDVVNYTKFIRGFENYAFGGAGRKVIPDELDEENCYAAFVNEDGVYPLNKELKAFLEAFYAANEELFSNAISADATAGTEWMFSLYYYDAEAEADPICGEYVCVEADYAYILTVNKNNSFVIVDATNDGDVIDNGSWSKDESGVYSFICGFDGPLVYNAANGVFTYTDWMQYENIFSSSFISDYTTADDNYHLSVSSDNTFSINDGAMTGTWAIAGDHFEITSDGTTYTVTRDSETGTLTCYDSNDQVVFEFVHLVYTLTSTDETATLIASANGTFTLTIGDDVVVKGICALEGAAFHGTTFYGSAVSMQCVFDDNNQGTITFTVYYEDGSDVTVAFGAGGGSGEEEDPICGEWAAEDDDYGHLTLTINADGTFIITDDDDIFGTEDGILESGTWSNEDGEYTFECDNYGDISVEDDGSIYYMGDWYFYFYKN